MQSLSPKRKKVRTRGGAISARRRQSEAHRKKQAITQKAQWYAPAEVLSPPAGGSPKRTERSKHPKKRTESNRKKEASNHPSPEAVRCS